MMIVIMFFQKNFLKLLYLKHPLTLQAYFLQFFMIYAYKTLITANKASHHCDRPLIHKWPIGQVLFYNQIVKNRMAKHLNDNHAHQYSTIALDTRKKLVELVISMGYSIGKAARKTRVKLSTAKMIVKRFRTTGDFFQSKKQKAERLSGPQQPINQENENNDHPQTSQPSVEGPDVGQGYASLQDYSQNNKPQQADELYYWPWIAAPTYPFSQGFWVMTEAGAFWLPALQ